MSQPPPPPSDRRPIASRNLPIFQRLASLLARLHISANTISILGMLSAILAGLLLTITPLMQPWQNRLHFLFAAIFIQIRLLANMLDGMVAIASGTASPVGELYNEIPDRISDTAILAGAGYALGGDPALGWAAACMALLVTYIRAVGKTVGVHGLFHGPMSKSHRMFTLTLACIYLAFAPDAWQPMVQLPWPWFKVGIMSAVLALILLGTLITAWRRLRRIVAAMRARKDEGTPP